MLRSAAGGAALPLRAQVVKGVHRFRMVSQSVQRVWLHLWLWRSRLRRRCIRTARRRIGAASGGTDALFAHRELAGMAAQVFARAPSTACRRLSLTRSLLAPCPTNGTRSCAQPLLQAGDGADARRPAELGEDDPGECHSGTHAWSYGVQRADFSLCRALMGAEWRAHTCRHARAPCNRLVPSRRT